MAYNWINPVDYTMETFLLFDRWNLRYILAKNPWYNTHKRDYKTDLAKALSKYPHVVEFCRRKAPNKELVSRGFEFFSHQSIEGGIIYDYRKQVIK